MSASAHSPTLGVRCRALGLIAAVGILTGCEGVPDLRFAEGDASTDGASSVPAPVPVGGVDGAVPIVVDAGAPPTVHDSGATNDGGTPGDAGATSDGGSLACIKDDPAPSHAACCDPGHACIGLGCAHCADCIQKDCKGGNSYCCAGIYQGNYYGIQCSPDGQYCP